jgi:alpha-tubulin suppressor-like RCC1 family protein
VSSLTNATAISAGQAETCALLSTGTVECWGYNIAGQLGIGTITNSTVPAAVTW